MEVVVSVAISLDGYLDDSSTDRLRLSSPEDWDDVLKLRGECDAILVGAGTLRADNPSLTLKCDKVKQERVNKGISSEIVKVSVTQSGDISSDMKFFTKGVCDKIIFTSNDCNLSHLEGTCQVIRLDSISARGIVDALSAKGYSTLMVEGGSEILTMFFREDMIDRLRLAVAPFFVGDSNSPRWVKDADFFANKNNRMKLISVRQLGDMAVMDYERSR